VTAEGNDVDQDITLRRLDPPVCGKRCLVWSGERVPQLGETVLVNAEETYQGIVIGYFQAHGYLGVKVKTDERCNGEVLAVFGAEIEVGDAPQNETVN